jgi:hypothetical protein
VGEIFDPTTVFGLLGPLILLLGVLAAGYAYLRSSAAKVWQENAQAYSERVDLLEKEAERCKTEVAGLKAVIAKLEERPDMDKVMTLISESHKATVSVVVAALQTTAATIAAGREASVDEILERIDKRLNT